MIPQPEAKLEALPTLWEMQSPPGPEIMLSGKKYLYFGGTGYLGLQANTEVIAAAQAAAAKYGVHSATSRAGFGMTAPVREVERRAAEFLGTEASLYLVSGYATNFAIISAISSAVDQVFIDESAHFCLCEAIGSCKQLKTKPIVFRYRDSQHLAELMKANCKPDWRPLVMSDGIFAMSGEIAPVAEYMKILAEYPGSMLLLDDAHAVASIGKNGRGSPEFAGISSDQVNRTLDDQTVIGPRMFVSGTLSKAIGGHGGIIAGSQAFIDLIKSSCGWFRGASAPAAPIAAATAKALEIVQSDPAIRQQLTDNVLQLRGALNQMNISVEMNPSPVIGFAIRDAKFMQALRQQLLERGIAIGYSQDYVGSGPEGCIRIAIFSTHTSEMIEKLIAELRKLLS